uniref:Uncharacterized protein n=1 Tax=Anguilla anguilla TaxID=7936 RepID=A0A0E9PR93_ANGAN
MSTMDLVHKKVILPALRAREWRGLVVGGEWGWQSCWMLSGM